MLLDCLYLSLSIIDPISIRRRILPGIKMSPESGTIRMAATKDDDQDVKQIVEASETSEIRPEITEAQAKRILLKTDLVIMPLIVLSMTLAFLDKVCMWSHQESGKC